MPQFMGKALNLIKTIKSGDPVLNLDRSVTAESLWPTNLDKEAEKAAIILRSFFIDGFIVPYRTLGTCPHQVIRECRGIAVLHVLRPGLHSAAASGSGVIVARLPDGKWSGASAIVVDLDLPQGVDVADVVIVVNDQAGLDLISSPNGMLGKSLTIEPGPIPESDTYAAQLRTKPRKKDAILYYVKSKGHLAEVDLKNMVIREATSENERFYGVSGVSAKGILSGQTKRSSGASSHLYSTLNALDQQLRILSGLPKAGKCPGDCRVRAPATANA